MTCAFAVTFEFSLRAPVTHRGTVAGGRATTCVARATRIAQEVLKPVGWSSMVCVLMERVDTLADPPDVDEATVDAQPPAAVPVSDGLSLTAGDNL